VCLVLIFRQYHIQLIATKRFILCQNALPNISNDKTKNTSPNMSAMLINTAICVVGKLNNLINSGKSHIKKERK
jgi:hypothetical protein